MINQDEVFVITEDDILTPGGKGKGKAQSQQRGASIALAKPPRSAENSRTSDETVTERNTPPRGTRLRQPHPAAAGSLSMFVWGLGQFYNGDAKLAMLFLMCEVLVVSFHYFMYMTWDRILSFSHIFFVSEWELMLYASSIDFCLIFFMIYNVAQAYRGAEAQGSRFGGLRNPFVSGLASALIPGWGQMLNGQLGKAIFFLFSFLLQLYLVGLYRLSPFFAVIADLDLQALTTRKVAWAGMAVFFVTGLCWALSAYDAVLVARYTRRARA
ncbi:MAG TPA: hypothetical protein VFT43_06210 [Candidatus Polarisedimenticolia bacterium]|nr:hypothetical protein [Candidatus Polarisedimenticolia bacterium]